MVEHVGKSGVGWRIRKVIIVICIDFISRSKLNLANNNNGYNLNSIILIKL